jgi:hypothetical protein
MIQQTASYLLSKYAQVLELGKSQMTPEFARQKAQRYLQLIQQKGVQYTRWMYQYAEPTLKALLAGQQVPQHNKDLAVLDVRQNYHQEIDSKEFEKVINSL